MGRVPGQEIVATSKGVVYKRLGKNTKPFYPSEYTTNSIDGFKGDYAIKTIKPTTKDDIDFTEYESLDDNIEYTKDKDFDEIQANVMILDYLSKNEYITRKEVERLCGFSSATSKRILKELREQEKIVIEGQNKSSRYKLK